MERKQFGIKSSFMCAVLLVLTFAFLTTSLAVQARSDQPSAAQKTQWVIEYSLVSDPSKKLSLCVGEEKAVFITLYRSMYPAGTTGPLPLEERAGAEIQAYSNNSNIGQFTYNKDTTVRIWSGSPQNGNSFATFIFVGKEAGDTKVEFYVNDTGDPPDWGKPKGITLDVEVHDCFEAYASGLVTGNAANEFTRKNICSLSDPFLISFRGASQAPGANMEIQSQRVVFLPDYQIYFATENQKLTGFGKTMTCRLIAVGDYDVKWHNNNRSQGDLVMTGKASLICEGTATSIGNHEFLIGIRTLKLNSGESCEE